jgi:glycosyltransferase involved in cell wall biosynthesis
VVVHAAYPNDVRVARQVPVAADEGYDVDIFAMREQGEAKCERIDDARVFRLPFSHRHGAGLLGALWEYVGFTLAASVSVAMHELRHHYDVVQIHNPPDFLMVAAVVSRLRGARIVFDVHDLASDMFAMRFNQRRALGFVDRVLRAIEGWATRFADVVITVHEPYRRELLARGVPAAKTSVVMNSVDERLLPACHDRTPDPRFRVVYHGTITPSYGVHLLVEAAAYLTEDIPDLAIEIYGVGDSLPHVIARGRELGLGDRLHISGCYLPQAEVLERVHRAQVGVIPNLENRLNRFALSSKLFEYVALRIPVVAADLPTIRAHFSDREIVFFRAGDPRSLADGLRAVAQDPTAASERATAALRRYRREYGWSASAERYAAVLSCTRNASPQL